MNQLINNHVFFVLIALFLLYSIGLCQNMNVEFVSELYSSWLPARHLDIVDNTAYVATGESGFRIVDISDPFNPVQIGYNNWVGNVLFVSVYENYAYLSTMDGLRIVDVSDPTQPVEVNSIIAEYGANRITFHDNYAFVCWGRDGLYIFNVDDPANPVEVSNLNPGGCINEIAIIEGYAITTGNYSFLCYLYVIDISDLLNPTIVGTYNKNAYVHDIQIVDDNLFICTGFKLEVIDISDPLDLAHLSFLSIASNLKGLYATEEYCYIASQEYFFDDFVIVNIADPSNPFIEGSYDLYGASYDVYVVDDYAFVASGSGSMRVIDVSSPSTPIEVGYYGSRIYPYELFLTEEICYSANLYTGVGIIDISNPFIPIELGSYNLGGGCAYEVEMARDYLCVAYSDSGLRILDVCDPANPFEVGYFDYGYPCLFALATSGNYVYTQTYRFSVIDISNPANPIEIGTIDYGGPVSALAVNGNYVYLAGGNYVFQIIDVSNPTAPIRRSYYITDDYANSVCVYDDEHVFVGYHFPDGVRVFDVTNPSYPSELYYFRTKGSVQGIAFLEDYAILAEDEAGLAIYDISNLELPQLTGYYRTPGDAMHVLLNDSIAYVADYYYLEILDISDAVSTLSTTELNKDFTANNTSFTISPNPFNAEAIISFDLRAASFVSLAIYDITGRKVARLVDGMKPAGPHQVVFDAKDLSSGVYFVRLEAGGVSRLQKAVFLK